MREDNKESIDKCDLLKWILHIIDARIKTEESLLQGYRDSGDEVVYFESRLRRDHAARALIAEELEKCDNDE